MQATLRKLHLKFRDGRVDHALLLVADTPLNRAALRAAEDQFASLPASQRSVLRALAEGRNPDGSPLIVL